MRQVGGGVRPVLSAAPATPWADTLLLHQRASVRMRAACASAGPSPASPALLGGAERACTARVRAAPAPRSRRRRWRRARSAPPYPPYPTPRDAQTWWSCCWARARTRARATAWAAARCWTPPRLGTMRSSTRSLRAAPRARPGRAPRPGCAAPRALRRARACGCCWGRLRLPLGAPAGAPKGTWSMCSGVHAWGSLRAGGRLLCAGARSRACRHMRAHPRVA
jgi:hypothetical protein